MATQKLSPEERIKHQQWIERNKNKKSKISRVELDNFIKLKISDYDWNIFKVHFSVCKKCESNNIEVEMIEEDYGYGANIVCLNCNYSYMLLVHSNLLL